MIEFQYETDFMLINETRVVDWIEGVISSEQMSYNQINFIFCNDHDLLAINQEHLHHDTLTDIITFDYSERTSLAGDIFISIDRVRENAGVYNVGFQEELHRVMAHGILHLAGYADKSDKDIVLMRAKEEEKMKLFHVEQ